MYASALTAPQGTHSARSWGIFSPCTKKLPSLWHAGKPCPCQKSGRCSRLYTFQPQKSGYHRYRRVPRHRRTCGIYHRGGRISLPGRRSVKKPALCRRPVYYGNCKSIRFWRTDAFTDNPAQPRHAPGGLYL